MIGSFNDIIFTVSSGNVRNFKDFKQDISVKYATHEVINSKPRLEYLGQNLETGGFSIELNASLGVDILSTIAKWNSYCKSAKVSRFILGGQVIGTQWVILSVSSAYGIITNNGKIRTAKLDISLQEYN